MGSRQNTLKSQTGYINFLLGGKGGFGGQIFLGGHFLWRQSKTN